MLRLLAFEAGTLLLLLTAGTSVYLPAKDRVPSALVLLGAVLACAATLWTARRRAGVARVLHVFAAAYCAAILLATIGFMSADPSPRGLGSGIGLGLTMGLLASLSISWLAYAALPSCFRVESPEVQIGIDDPGSP